MTDYENQLAVWKAAVEALGGTRKAAAELAIAERSIVRLNAGRMWIHEGHMRDMAAALRRHIALCRELERQLDPTFHENLYPGQPKATGSYTRGKS